jgi:hypothetical protein
MNQELKQEIIHKAPDGWKVRGFDNFVCGCPAYAHEPYAHELCQTEWEYDDTDLGHMKVNCPNCLQKRPLAIPAESSTLSTPVPV